MDEIKTNSSLLQMLDVGERNRFIAVRENGLADANFIITNLMKQIFAGENNIVCLLIMHNTLGHYQNVGQKLKYDLLKKSQLREVAIIEIMKYLTSDISCNNETNNVLSNDKENISKRLYFEVKDKIDTLLKLKESGRVYLIMDDISHLLDLGVDVKYVLTFINCCAQLITNPRVSVIINCHVCTTTDEIISNALDYITDLSIDVSPLKTGMSYAVSGVIKIKRKLVIGPQSKLSTYHYRAYDKEIKTFAPGETIHYL